MQQLSFYVHDFLKRAVYPYTVLANEFIEVMEITLSLLTVIRKIFIDIFNHIKSNSKVKPALLLLGIALIAPSVRCSYSTLISDNFAANFTAQSRDISTHLVPLSIGLFPIFTLLCWHFWDIIKSFLKKICARHLLIIVTLITGGGLIWVGYMSYELDRSITEQIQIPEIILASLGTPIYDSYEVDWIDSNGANQSISSMSIDGKALKWEVRAKPYYHSDIRIIRIASTLKQDDLDLCSAEYEPFVVALRTESCLFDGSESFTQRDR